MGFNYAKESWEDHQAPVASTFRPKPRLPDLPPIDLDDELSPPARTNGKSKAGRQEAEVIVLDDDDDNDDEEMDMEEFEPPMRAEQRRNVESDNEEDAEQLAKVSVQLLRDRFVEAELTPGPPLSSTSNSPTWTSRSIPSASFAPPSNPTE